jgi:hypothetical protein
MEQQTGIRSLYDEFFRGYGAEIRLSSPEFRPNSTYKRTYSPSVRIRQETALANPMPVTTRQFLRRLAVLFVMAYPVGVGAMAALKPERSPWAEVFYGPAITSVSCYLLVVFGVWLECRVRQ